MKEVLLPRATINIPCAYEFMAIMDGRRSRQFDYVFSLKPELRRKAPGASIAGSITAFYLYSGEFFQG